MTTASRRTPARERLLATASDLFYDHGIRAVGIDRILEESHVAKATLYAHFPSKDALIEAYLRHHLDLARDHLANLTRTFAGSPRAITALFEEAADMASTGNYLGCRFAGATSEHLSEESHAAEIADEYRNIVLEFFQNHVRGASVLDRRRASEVLLALYEGAKVTAGTTGRAAIERLIPTVRVIAENGVEEIGGARD